MATTTTETETATLSRLVHWQLLLVPVPVHVPVPDLDLYFVVWVQYKGGSDIVVRSIWESRSWEGTAPAEARRAEPGTGKAGARAGMDVVRVRLQTQGLKALLMELCSTHGLFYSE